MQEKYPPALGSVATRDDLRGIALSLPEVVEGEDGTRFTIDVEELERILLDAWRARAPKALLKRSDGIEPRATS